MTTNQHKWWFSLFQSFQMTWCTTMRLTTFVFLSICIANKKKQEKWKNNIQHHVCIDSDTLSIIFCIQSAVKAYFNWILMYFTFMFKQSILSNHFDHDSWRMCIIIFFFFVESNKAEIFNFEIEMQFSMEYFLFFFFKFR